MSGRSVVTPLVSVVTPAYNQAEFLVDTIESVLGQDYPRIEYRVIDDGSTDGTREILSAYEGRLLFESQPNAGQTTTINRGWERATGDILVWLNSDDTFLPGAVSAAVRYLVEHPEVDIVFGDTLFTRADGSPIERSRSLSAFDYRRFLVECENPIPQPSAFARRSVIEQTGLLDPHYRYFMDWDYWLRAGLHARIAYTPELLSTYRLHGSSNTVANTAKYTPELEYMYTKLFARDDLPAWAREVERRAMANMYFTMGGYYLRAGDRAAAAEMARKARRADRSVMRSPRMLRKYSYCAFGGSALYRGARAALGR